MPHEIGEMFWYGAMPWHGLGRELPEPATLDEALHAGGLDWAVQMVPLSTAESPPSPAPHRRAIVRTDRAPGSAGRVVGVVHDGFRPLQNREGAALLDRLLGAGKRHYHTGGYLRNGEVVWLLARLPGRLSVSGDDTVEPYLLYSNSHDGSRAIDIRLTTVRVVCSNTLSFALDRASSRVFRRAHKSSPAGLEQEAQTFFGRTTAQMRETEATMQALAARPCDDEAFARFLRALLPDPPAPAMPATEATQRAFERRRNAARASRGAVAAIRERGLPQLGIPVEKPTWWGAVNAVTAWVDHVQRDGAARVAHALLGQGDRFKVQAFESATAAAQLLPADRMRRNEANATQAA